MRPNDVARYASIRRGLTKHAKTFRMPGIATSAASACFERQLVDSMRRVDYPATLLTTRIGQDRSDPANAVFDPIRGAIYHSRLGNHDEACWLVFLFVHFGKSRKGGYGTIRHFYGGGSEGRWTWARVSKTTKLESWVSAANQRSRKASLRLEFGPHRPYESEDSVAKSLSTYVNWIGPGGKHENRFHENDVSEPGARFERLYKSMNVYRFGRLARFDYLAMLGKLGLANVFPPRTYLSGATGPKKGARLLYLDSRDDSSLDQSLETRLVEFGKDLNIGQQAIEDALCNWQKAPMEYERFLG
jgi:hypothetical protein